MYFVDMHCDTVSRLLQKKRNNERETLRQNSGHVDVEKLQKSGYLLQNFALFVQLAVPHDPWQETMELYELYREEMEQNQNNLAPVLCYADIEKNKKAGKISALLTLEEGGVCQGQVQRLEELYTMGVRMLTLTWNHQNELGSPNLDWSRGRQVRSAAEGLHSKKRTDMVWKYLNTPDVTHGLTPRGIEFVERMEEMGMIPDVSHLSDAGFYDVARISKKPFVASHSNARSVCPCVRNMNDHMIRTLAEKGGVMGLNFCADFLMQMPPGASNPGSLQAIVAHARQIVKVGGIECLGLGTDFDGIDTHAEVPHAGVMERLYDALRKGGFTAAQMEKIFCGNVLRLYRETLSK